MSNFDVAQSSFVTHFRTVQTRIHELVQPLSHQQLWSKPYAYGNSVGNLILHLTGNLNYYIGAQMGGTGYVRHRDVEFSDTGLEKSGLLNRFNEAIDVVVKTISQQSEQDWPAPYTAVGTQNLNRFSMILNCASHASHHVGQIMYLQRELIGSHA